MNQGEQDVGAPPIVAGQYVYRNDQVTEDGGRTWRDLQLPFTSYRRAASATHLFQLEEGAVGTVRAYPWAGGAPLSVEASGYPTAAWGTRVALDDGSVVDLADGRTLLTLPEIRGLGEAGVVTVQDAWQGNQFGQTATIYGWDGSVTATVSLEPLESRSTVTVTATEFRAVLERSDRWELCRAPLDTGELTCLKLVDVVQNEDGQRSRSCWSRGRR